MNLGQAADTAVKAEVTAIEKAKGGDPTALSYVKSFHIIRTAVGIAGAALPFVLVIGWRLLHGEWNLLGSLSAYYHTGVRDAFVSILVVVGALLIAYKVASAGADNPLGTFAGLAAIGVAFIPTKIDTDKQPYASNTAVQEWLNPDLARWIHYICASTFIVLLGFICLLFARLEDEKQHTGLSSASQWQPSEKWSKFHRRMGYLIFAIVALVLLSQLTGILDDYSILVGEALATWAFAASWLAKGIDPKVLRADAPDQGQQQVNLGENSRVRVTQDPKATKNYPR